MGDSWTLTEGDGPIVATAIHDGHRIRPELEPLLALDEAGRLREEDPFTGGWTACAPTRIVVGTSRFEVDINRPPETCVYRRPEDAWGLTVWSRPLPEELAAASRAIHARYYAALGEVCERKAREHGRFVLLDLHSYNHRRDGPDGPPADPVANPEVNLGTGTVDRARWGGLVDRFRAELAACEVMGEPLDVRENVKFRGGYQSRWVHERFPGVGCALAVEFKKTFMDEWTGEPDPDHLEQIGAALAATVPGLLASLG